MHPAKQGHNPGHAPKKHSPADTKKQGIFVIVVGLILLLIVGAYSFMQSQPENLPWLVLVVVVLLAFSQSNIIIFLHDYERAVIFRFGKINRVGGPGWALTVPFIEDYRLVDLRTQTIDLAKQDVITKDNIVLTIDAVIYLRINKDPTSVINSVVEIEDYKQASILYVTSLLRDVTGTLKMAEVIANREEVSTRLKLGLEKAAKGWGVTVEGIELQEVVPPASIVTAMHEERAAEHFKKARIEQASAHKAEIDAVQEAAEKLSDNALGYYYIRALEKMSEGKATKIVFPMEISKLAESLGSRFGVSAKAADHTELIKQFAPLIAAALKAEVKKRKKKTKKK